MNLFENLQLLKENQNTIQTLEDICVHIENKFEEKFISTFGKENELYANTLWSATKDIRDEYFSEGYDIVFTVQQVPQFTDDFKDFVKSFANGFKYEIEECSRSTIRLLISVDEL